MNTIVIKRVKNPDLKTIYRKAKVNFPWLPPLQLQSPTDYLVLSRCTRDMVAALEEIRNGLILLGSPSFASMKLLHVPGSGGESDSQVALYCRLRGWQEMMNKANLGKQRQSTELYAQGYGLKEIARIVKTRDIKIRFHISKGLEEYSKMFTLDTGNGKH